jgi:hypothetical protein
MIEPSIAKTILLKQLSAIAEGDISNAQMASDIHAGINQQYHWIKKIVELHQKEDAKKIKTQPLFASKAKQ